MFSRVILSLVMAAGLCAGADAGKLFSQARKAEKAGDYVQALLLYSQARALQPGESRFALAAEAVRPLAAQGLAAAGKLQSAIALDPASAFLLQSATSTPPEIATSAAPAGPEEVQRMRAPVELEPESKITNLDLTGTAEEVYQQLAREFGLDVLFDSDYQGADRVRLNLTDATFSQALLALNDLATSFVVPVHSKMFLVAADNSQKRTELEPVVTVTVPIPDTINPEEATQLAQAVQQSLDLRQLHVDIARSQVLMRGTLTRVRMAQELFQHLARPKGEVVLEITLLSVSEGVMRSLGLGLPNTFPVENLTTIWNNQPSVANTAAALLGVGGGKTVFGLAIGAARLVANRIATRARQISSFQVRAIHGTPATLHVGESFPIINARFSPVLFEGDVQDEIDQGTFREPFPSFTFEDLGLILDVTPQVHNAHEVSLDFEVEFRLLSGSTFNDIPIIANRQFQSQARLKEGEVALLSGIGVAQTSRTRGGLSPLADIPWLGHLFSTHTRQQNAEDLLVVVRPRIVRLPPAEVAPSLTLRHGPEARPLSGI